MCQRRSRCSTVTCVICKSVTDGVVITYPAERRYWGVHTMRFFQTCRSVGKRFTAAPFKEKPCERTKTSGLDKTELIGHAGRFVLGRPLKALWEGFSSLQKTLPVANIWKRRSQT